MKFIRLTENSGEHLIINQFDIIYLRSLKDYTEIIIKDDRCFHIKESIDEVYGLINEDNNKQIMDLFNILSKSKEISGIENNISQEE